jgi:hypothetical protein
MTNVEARMTKASRSLNDGSTYETQAWTCPLRGGRRTVLRAIRASSLGHWFDILISAFDIASAGAPESRTVP